MHSKCTPTHSMSDILARTANALFNRKGIAIIFIDKVTWFESHLVCCNMVNGVVSVAISLYVFTE